MALLREHIQATQPHAPSSCQAWGHSMLPNGTCSILDRGLSSIMGPSFKSLLAPKTFTLPDTQPPPIKTASLEELMTSMHPAWMVETLNLFDIVWSSHDPAAAVNRDVVGNVDRLKSVWLDPMRQLLTKWKDELACAYRALSPSCLWFPGKIVADGVLQRVCCCPLRPSQRTRGKIRWRRKCLCLP